MVDPTPLYDCSADEARRLGELDRWRPSHRANIACKETIEAAIRRDFDGMHLAPNCAKSVIADYGFKRVRYVLATTLREKSYDGRFSQQNKAWFDSVYIPNDQGHNSQLVVGSHPAVLDGFMTEFRQAYQALGLFGPEHCIQQEDGVDYQDKVVAVDPSELKEKFLTVENQLWLAQSGFGCNPASLGRAVFATCLADGERARWNRESFLGVVKEDCLPDWAKSQVEKLRAGQQIGPIERPVAPAEGDTPGMTQSM